MIQHYFCNPDPYPKRSKCKFYFESYSYGARMTSTTFIFAIFTNKSSCSDLPDNTSIKLTRIVVQMVCLTQSVRRICIYNEKSPKRVITAQCFGKAGGHQVVKSTYWNHIRKNNQDNRLHPLQLEHEAI